MEKAELNDLHHAEIAMAHASVVNGHIATGAAKKAQMADISKFSFDSSDAESDAKSCEPCRRWWWRRRQLGSNRPLMYWSPGNFQPKFNDGIVPNHD